MSTIATITADFRAQSAQFLSELKKISSQSRSTGKDVRAGLNDAFRDLAAIASVGMFAGFVRSAAEAADQAAKTADRLGIATERLQALKFAAAGAGVDVSLLERALGEAQKRLAEAANTGKGDAADWLRRLNLNINELQQLSPDQLFARYSDAIDTLNNRGQQFAATEALMGKGTRDLFNLIAGGSAGLRQAQQDIKDLGIELSRIDARQIENARDQMERLKLVSQGFGQQIAVAVAPYVGEFARQVLNSATQVEDLRGKIELVARGAYIAFEIAANAARILDAAVSGIVAGIAEAVLALERLGKKAKDVGLAIAHGIGYYFPDDEKKAQSEASFFEALAERAKARAQSALEAVKSFSQISADADRIVAQARAAAQQQIAAAAAKNNQRPGGPVTTGDEFDIKAYVDQQFELAQKREEVWADFDKRFIEERVATERQIAQERAQIEAEAERAIQQQREATANYAIGLFQALGQKHKIFALAALAIERVTTIQRILQANAIAAQLAFASQLIPGDPTSLARAYAAQAAVLAQGRVQAALAAATGVVQAVNLFSSGGNAPGSPTNPIFTQPSGSGGDQPAFGAGSQNVTQIVITGNYGWTPEIIDDLVATLRDEITDRDLIIITPQSRQALNLTGG